MTEFPVIGFVGLGRMGVLMAANIARAGFPLVAWNRSPEKLGPFADDIGCQAAPDVVSLARDSDIMITMVADGNAIEEFLLAKPEVLNALKGKLVLDMSTTGPSFAVRLARRLAEHDVRFVESPVSGSTAAARSGSLTLLIGAEPEDLTRVRPVLQILGENLLHLGAPGAGSLAKLAINNLIYGINQCVSEALVLAERGGIDREVIYDAFLASAAAAPVLRYRRQMFLHPGDGEVSFTLELAEKDMRLTTDLARELRSPMPQAELNLRIARAAMGCGLDQDDLAIVAEYLRRSAPAAATNLSED